MVQPPFRLDEEVNDFHDEPVDITNSMFTKTSAVAQDGTASANHS